MHSSSIRNGAAIAAVVGVVAACAAGRDVAGVVTTGSAAGAGGAGGAGGLGIGGVLGGACKATEEDLDVSPTCEQKAPPNAFSPVVQWEWTAPLDGIFHYGSVVIPLVGNFTD